MALRGFAFGSTSKQRKIASFAKIPKPWSDAAPRGGRPCRRRRLWRRGARRPRRRAAKAPGAYLDPRPPAPKMQQSSGCCSRCCCFACCPACRPPPAPTPRLAIPPCLPPVCASSHIPPTPLPGARGRAALLCTLAEPTVLPLPLSRHAVAPLCRILPRACYLPPSPGRRLTHPRPSTGQVRSEAAARRAQPPRCSRPAAAWAPSPLGRARRTRGGW